jgi:hypothetical protein
MGDPDLKSEELVERISQEAAGRRNAKVEEPERLKFSREEPLGRLPEVAFLNEHAPLELASSRGVLAGLRYRFKARVAMPLLMILRPVVVTQVSLLNNVVNRIDLLLDRSDRLALRLNEVADEVHHGSQRVEERAQLLHDLLEARVERLERQAAKDEPPAG